MVKKLLGTREQKENIISRIFFAVLNVSCVQDSVGACIFLRGRGDVVGSFSNCQQAADRLPRFELSHSN